MQLRYYQENAVQSIFDYFNHAQGNPLIAMPTGTGKALVQCEFVRRVMHWYPSQRFLMLTHVKELIAQNSSTLERIWPNAPVGIYSSGLKKRECASPIVFGGVASVRDNEEAFGFRDLIVIDEAHLLSPGGDTMYQKIIAHFKGINPALKVIGLTATPYRMGQGEITDGGLFTDICFDITGIDAFNRLIAEGYLSPLYPKPTDTVIDTTGLRTDQSGDFSIKELESRTQRIIAYGLQEFAYYGTDRQSWLCFMPGVETAIFAAERLNEMGIPAVAIHSKLKQSERDEAISGFKSGKYRAATNNNVLTTGFDHPPVDYIGMFRPTMSPGLWVQMLGRGTRPSLETGKRNCLVMDFARNTPRLGPINDPKKPRKPGETPGDAPLRICPAPGCGVYNFAGARYCIACGFEFPRETAVYSQAGVQPLLAGDAPIVEWLPVQFVIYSRHEKQGKPDSVKVTYHCGLQRFPQWVAVESNRKMACDYWRKAAWGDAEPPKTASEFLSRQQELKQPQRIRVWLNATPYPQVLSNEY